MESDPGSRDAAALRIGLDAAVLLAQAGWPAVVDSVLSGISHELSGRVASLDALVGLCHIQGQEQTPITSYLESEVRKLQSTVELLRLVPGDLGADAEGALPKALATRTLALSRMQSLLFSIDMQTSMGNDVAPIFVNQSRLFRILLILLRRAGSCADHLGLTEIVMTGETVGDEVELRIVPGPDQKQGRPEDPGDENIKALAEVLAMDGGSFFFPEGGFVGVRLPTLARVRAQEGC